MGRVVLVCRLAAQGTRRHLAQAILLVLAVAAAATVLTVGLALSGVTKVRFPAGRWRAALPED